MPSLSNIIKSTFKSPDKTKVLIQNALGTQDEHGATNLRNTEVAMTIVGNGKNDTAMNEPSRWEKILDAHHHQTGYGLFGLTVGMFLVGIGATFYRQYRALSYDSYDFYLRHLEKENFSLTTFTDLKETAITENEFVETLLPLTQATSRKLYWLKKQFELDAIALEDKEANKLLEYAAAFARFEKLEKNNNRTSKEEKIYVKLKIELKRIENILALQVAFNKQLKGLTGIYEGQYRINFASDNAIQLITIKKPTVQTKTFYVNSEDTIENELIDIQPPKLWKSIKKFSNTIAKRYVKFSSESKIAKGIRSAWDLINWQTMAFWGIWIAINFLFGLSVLGPSITLGWVVLGVATAPLVIYGLWKLGKYIHKKLTNKKDLTSIEKTEQAIEKAEQKLLLQTLKQKLFIEQDQSHKESIILELGNKKFLSDDDNKIAKQSTLDNTYKNANSVENSASYRALAGSTRERRSKWLVTSFLGLVSGFVGPQFIFWVAQTFFSTLAHTGVVAAHTGIASILHSFAITIGSPIVMLAVGIPIAIFFCFKALVKEHIAQKEHINNVKNILNEEIYIDQQTALPKWQYFDKLLTEIKTLKNTIQQTREKITLKIKDNKNYTKQDFQTLTGSTYNLNNSDPLKHDFFDKQRHKKGKWTFLKQGFKRFFALQGGAQTGVLITRFLFIGTTLLASIIAGPHAVVAFFVIAAIIGVAVGVSRIMNYHFEAKQKQRTQALEQFKHRIDFAQEEVKKLRLLNIQLENNYKQLEPELKNEQSVIEVNTANIDTTFSPTEITPATVKVDSHSRNESPTNEEQKIKNRLSKIDFSFFKSTISSEKNLSQEEPLSARLDRALEQIIKNDDSLEPSSSVPTIVKT